MFADMTKDSQRPSTPKTSCILSNPLFSYPQSIRDKANQAAHIKDEKGAGGGAWLTKHENLSPQAAANIEILAYL